MRRVGFGAVLVLAFISFLATYSVVSDVNKVVFSNSGSKLSPKTNTVNFNFADNLPDINQIFAEINEVRHNKGISPLEPNSQLTTLAQKRADDMMNNQYYGHINKNGHYFYDLMKQSHYKVEYGCENLDIQFTIRPTTYVNDWLNSSKGHRECALDNRVSKAGYAVTRVSAMAGEDVPTYIVVAIHSTTPKGL